MRISDSSIEKILRQGEVISESQLAELKMEAERTHHSLQLNQIGRASCRERV